MLNFTEEFHMKPYMVMQNGVCNKTWSCKMVSVIKHTHFKTGQFIQVIEAKIQTLNGNRLKI